MTLCFIEYTEELSDKYMVCDKLKYPNDKNSFLKLP